MKGGGSVGRNPPPQGRRSMGYRGARQTCKGTALGGFVFTPALGPLLVWFCTLILSWAPSCSHTPLSVDARPHTRACSCNVLVCPLSNNTNILLVVFQAFLELLVLLDYLYYSIIIVIIINIISIIRLFVL